MGSSNRDLLSRMSVLIEIEDTVETVEGVLVKVTGDLSGDSTGVTTVVEDKTCSEGEGTVGAHLDVLVVLQGIDQGRDCIEGMCGEARQGPSRLTAHLVGTAL